MIEIYMLSRVENSKSYVGLTSRKAYGNGDLIKMAKKKYGVGGFVHMILARTESLEEAANLERFYISFFQTLTPNGYNIALGGYGGESKTEEMKKKTSLSMIRHYENNPGRRQEISKLFKGKPSHKRGSKTPEEVKIKISESLYKAAFRHTEEHKNMMREKFKNRVMSDETKLKMSISAKARAATPEGMARLKMASQKALEKKL